MEHPKNGHTTTRSYQQVVNHSGPGKRFSVITLFQLGDAEGCMVFMGRVLHGGTRFVGAGAC